MTNSVAPVYLCGYSDEAKDLTADGTVPVPQGPGLEVIYDWKYIEDNKTAIEVYT